nr:MAG TPA: hypothetical protein [Caudoviricetes sp.]
MQLIETPHNSTYSVLAGIFASLKHCETFRKTDQACGGDEGNRTPVQKRCPKDFSERSRCFKSQTAIVQRQTTLSQLKESYLTYLSK